MASLLVLVCDNTATAESETWRERPNAPLTMERMLPFRELYLGSRNSPAGEHWTASPIRAPLDLLRKCPETLIMIAGQDLLRGETFRFAWRLQEVNVPVDIREYKGAPQPPFMAMDGLLETGRRGMDDLAKGVEKSLAKYLEDSVVKPSDVDNEFDRRNLLEQKSMMSSSRCHRKPGSKTL
jgi:acetyl esterase/lipase